MGEESTIARQNTFLGWRTVIWVFIGVCVVFGILLLIYPRATLMTLTTTLLLLVSLPLYRYIVFYNATHQTSEAVAPSSETAPSPLETLLQRDTVVDEINYMSGPEFERFMADFLRRQGYEVEETPLSGDQGVDLVLPDFDGKRVVVQLKRYTRPVGNDAVQATFAGMAHYRAKEGWVITTSTFTKSARELARSTRVRLIDGKELAEWLEGLREQE